MRAMVAPGAFVQSAFCPYFGATLDLTVPQSSTSLQFNRDKGKWHARPLQ